MAEGSAPRFVQIAGTLSFPAGAGLIAVSVLWPARLPYALLGLAGLVLLHVVCWRSALRTPADLLIGILFVAALLSLWNSPDRETSLPQWQRLVSGIGLFYLAATQVEAGRRVRWIRSLAFGLGLILSLLAPFTVEWITDKVALVPVGLYDRMTLLAADPIHPNVLAGTLGMIWPLSVATLLFGDKHETGRLERGLTWSAAVGIGLVLLISQSRGAWAAAAVSVGLLVLLRWPVMSKFAAAAVMLAVIGLLLAQADNADALFTADFLNDWNGRIEIWARGIWLIQDFPWTGTGMGTYGLLTDSLHPFVRVRPGSVPHAHNLFIQVGADLGVLGLAAWLGIALLMVWLALQIRWGDDSLRAGLLASFAALAVHGLFDAVLWGLVRTSPLVWLFWGIVIAAWRLRPGQKRIA
jgi:putative inorganic carbon (HCO3(-)) transporter